MYTTKQGSSPHAIAYGERIAKNLSKLAALGKHLPDPSQLSAPALESDASVLRGSPGKFALLASE